MRRIDFSAVGAVSQGPSRAAAVFWALALLTATPVLAQSSSPTLSDARIGNRDGQTRFVLEFDRAPPYRIFALAGPDRVVIDLPSVVWNDPKSGQAVGRGLIAGYRHGLFKPGVTRVVIDLAAPASVARNFTLGADDDAGPRIVVDLTPAAATAQSTEPVESPGWAAYSEKLSRATPVAARPDPPPGPTKRVVVVDPGHGGIDPGGIGVSGVYEKNVVLAFAKVLRDALAATGRYDVVMTRDRDIYIPLRDRYKLADSVGAELFISLHANIYKSATLRGFSVYTLSDKASDKETAALAQKENLSDVLAGTDLTGYEADVTSILISLAQQSVNQSSTRFAETLVKEMRRSTELLKKPHRFAGFAVLKSPNVPSVLVELGYLSNRSDEANLCSPKWRRPMAAAMVSAIDRFFDYKEKMERS